MSRGYIATAAKQDWGTPLGLFYVLDGQYGFTVDAAASNDNALCSKYWTEKDDGAAQSWAGERVWCNPPYGREATPFIRKAASREADLAVLLLPARTDTKVWHECIFGVADDIQFLKGRLRFQGAAASAPFPSALVVWRKQT